MRMLRLLAIVVACTGCAASAVYHPGSHLFATPARGGDVYVSAQRGAVPTNVARNPTSRDLQVAVAFTDRYVAFGRWYRARGEWVGNHEHLEHSGTEVGLGTVARRRGAWLTQDRLGISRARSDAALSSQMDGEEWPLQRAEGTYTRAYAQRSLVRRGVAFDVGGSGRLSAVSLDRFKRRRPDGSSFPPGRAYFTQEMPDSGSRFGMFLEWGAMLRFGYRHVKFGPEVSVAMPLFKTAFETQPVSLGLGVGVNIEPRGRK